MALTPAQVDQNWATASDALSAASLGFGVVSFLILFTPAAPLAPVLGAISVTLGGAATLIDCVRSQGGGSCVPQVLAGAAGPWFGAVVRGTLRQALKADGSISQMENVAIFGWSFPQEAVWAMTD